MNFVIVHEINVDSLSHSHRSISPDVVVELLGITSIATRRNISVRRYFYRRSKPAYVAVTPDVRCILVAAQATSISPPPQHVHVAYSVVFDVSVRTYPVGVSFSAYLPTGCPRIYHDLIPCIDAGNNHGTSVAAGLCANDVACGCELDGCVAYRRGAGGYEFDVVVKDDDTVGRNPEYRTVVHICCIAALKVVSTA